LDIKGKRRRGFFIMAERRQLKMHNSLLWNVIHAQAGKIEKSILEGVMNSVDAGSTKCDVVLKDDRFSIIDDGKGFRDDQEIEEFFETFGTPHVEGDAKYGKFRMGRGQMFAFGRNVWTTGNYRMTVDLKPQKEQVGKDFSLGYDFEKTKKEVNGCHIDVKLYEKMLPSDYHDAVREVEKFVKYVGIPVTLNGKLVSVNPEDEKWDEITEDAYIRRKSSGGLLIYNLGAFVKEQPAWYNAVSGVVVSKKQLELNFARNDVQNSCKIWKRVDRLLKDQSIERAERATPLTQNEREFYARQLASGEVSAHQLDSTRILTDVTGSHHPFKKLYSVTSFSVAPIGDRVAEMAHTRKMAFVFSQECAERFGASTPAELKKVFAKILGDKHKVIRLLAPVDAATFNETISSQHETLKDTELNKKQRMALSAIREGAKALHRSGYWFDYHRSSETFFDHVNRRERPARKIMAGVSDTAQGWTNGTSNIWIEREQLKKVNEGMKGFMQLSGLLLHEYIHREADTGTHDHGVDFYECFHDYALDSDILYQSSKAMLKSMLSQLRADQAKGISNVFTTVEDDLVEVSRMGLGDFEADGAIKADEGVVDELIETLEDVQAQLEAESPTPVEEDVAPEKVEETVEDEAPSISHMAARQSRPKRRVREADDSQFVLKF
jgi:hypothetical protein